ncbi:protein IQ-DOMAIN 14-like [Cynara cardunculus var. scolymus]|uniref:protein IQ-DOMAIN 14-like n=1 Tax=Cynara cardunculus var. scolymus TaxID=59895 RepID=UPI000D6284E9|nr:protein IQ-DOMAIN 14-like [Cynara cardunculus var. scolymus]XP_024985001.1 protein IQ-DOMAIN 14-like [Cynara cardunculus var. scolymus]
MGKKGTWFSAIKRLFTSNSKLNNEPKQNKARFKHGSFFPRFREPSSIEKILGEIDQQHNLHLLQQSQPPSSTPTITSPTLVHHEITEPPLQRLSATRIQAAFRGYMARRSFNSKPLTTGLLRLQALVRGQHVKRQTVNAMKQMQLLVRVQTQIQSRRIQMLQNQPLKPQPNKQLNNLLPSLEMGDEYWDDSLITKEEREARLQRKVEAVIKREKAMAYAYSHQLWKTTPNSAQNSIRSGGYPWWWSRLERQFPCDVKNNQFASTPSRATPVSPRLIKKQNNQSPMSSRSMVPPRTRQRMRYSMKDDDSLMSCPAFSVPNYMSPTVSAKAKARPTSNPKDRMPSSPGSERRFSFPPTPNSNGSLNWKKGSGSSRKHKSPGSIGELSMDSAISVERRKAFNRFV